MRNELTTVRVVWEDRDRELSTQMILTSDRRETHTGEPLLGFWGPNIYATPSGAWSWFLKEEPLRFLMAAQQDFVDVNMSILIVDAWLSWGDQLDKFRRKPNLAVHPKDSKHPLGEAIDVRIAGGEQEDLEYLLGIYGWRRTVEVEPWHFEWFEL